LDFTPCLARSAAGGEIEKITLGHPLLDDYLEKEYLRAAEAIEAQAARPAGDAGR
jgi:hypothetical protein